MWEVVYLRLNRKLSWLLWVFFIGAIVGTGTWMYFHNGHGKEVVAAMFAAGSALSFVWILYFKLWSFILKCFYEIKPRS